MDMTLGTCTVRTLCRSGLSTAVARELPQYILRLVGVQVVKGDKVGIEQPHNIPLYMGKGLRIIS